MAKLSVFIDKRTPNSKGLFPIKIRINNGASATTVSSKIYVIEKAFTGNPEKVVEKTYPNAVVIIPALRNYISNMQWRLLI